MPFVYVISFPQVFFVDRLTDFQEKDHKVAQKVISTLPCNKETL